MSETVAEPVVAPIAPDAPVAPKKKAETSLLKLGHVLPGLCLMIVERENVVYVKAKWLLTFFYQCRVENVEWIMRELRDTKELNNEIVTLTVGKREDAWFTVAGVRIVLGMVPYRMTRKERAELLDELKKLEKTPVAEASGGAGEEKPRAPEVFKLKDGQETVIKMRQEEGKEGDGDGWLDVRVVWLNGKEYVSTRDVVKHMIEKTGKLVVKAWTQVKPGIDAELLATHKFKGSGEVVQDVIKRHESRGLLRALTGEAAERNRGRMLAAIAGDNEVAGAGGGGRPGVGAHITEEQLLEALDELYPGWLERATGVPGAKRARRA